MGRLNDKIAIVTGGASGLGAGIAQRFVEEGALTIITDINPEGEAVAKRLDAEFLTKTSPQRAAGSIPLMKSSRVLVALMYW